MKPNQTDILCCPSCKEALSQPEEIVRDVSSSNELLCPGCNKKFRNTDGYVDFLGEKGMGFSSKREKIVRSVYAKVYTPATNFMFLLCGGVKNARKEVLSRIEIKNGDMVLETGMGAGENFPWLNRMADNLTFYGIDIQKQMMVHCMKNFERWNIKGEIYRADAEELPFRDERFDVVFHLGAINLFQNKKKAIDEMIRVAKPGTRIVIADETQKAGRLFNIFTGSDDEIIPPVDLIPKEMADIHNDVIWRGYGYVISFMKP